MTKCDCLREVFDLGFEADGYAPSEIATTAVNLGMAGDLNVDGDVDVEDVTMLVNMILKEGEEP